MNIDNLNKVSKKFKYGKRLQPTRDWLALLSLFAVALIISIVHNLWAFSQVTRGQTIGNAAVTTPAQIKLDQVKGLFDARAAERDRYGSEYHFVDPSR